MSRFVAIATSSLIAISALPVAAQPQAPGPRSSIVNQALITQAKQRALTTIQGNALDSSNGRLANAVVRLRDARYGSIVDRQLTDKSGLFAFKAIDPGSYIVELMSSDKSILAASELLNVNLGEVESAVVKLPVRIPAFTPGATAAVILAAAVGVAAVVPTIPISPNQ
jgi:hypothetical protein